MSDIHGRTLEEWTDQLPLIGDLTSLRETQWFNPGLQPVAQALSDVGLTRADIEDAAARLKRFAPYFALVFPETRHTGGILESPLVATPDLHAALAREAGEELPGDLWLKLDSELPVSGSIKARGGIYEVLKHAEDLAVGAGLLSLDDDYAILAEPRFTEFFGQHTVAVGSTGNLGLSIGIMSARLGFAASVHMSADARQWKKDTLRSHGVSVFEYESDYSEAVRMGRAEAAGDPTCYFVDDENSRSLFLGYAVAAHRLAGQLQAFDVPVDAEHPLFVYLPCGVGGGPGGVAFGLKVEFGDNVHAVFAEPTHSPSMFLGVYTGLHDATSVQDFGIDNVTAADGLACGRPSGFVGTAMQHLIDGFVTVSDDNLYRRLALLHDTEGIDIEPSSTAGLAGLQRVVEAEEYRTRLGLSDARLANATHIAWATGGSMVPPEEMASYVAKGDGLLP
ncbi:MAG: D-serine ammonia-lyase [Cellulomonadaceae bacterium]